jgi:hypothetical protein
MSSSSSEALFRFWYGVVIQDRSQGLKYPYRDDLSVEMDIGAWMGRLNVMVLRMCWRLLFVVRSHTLITEYCRGSCLVLVLVLALVWFRWRLLQSFMLDIVEGFNLGIDVE